MRLEVTRRSDLAVRALCALAAGSKLKGADLAKATGSSQPFIAQVMSPLVRRGWVRSDPGPSGGYSVVVDLSEISMLSLIETIEGPMDTETCALRGGPCPGSDSCALHDAWEPARNALLARLAETPVAVASDCN